MSSTNIILAPTPEIRAACDLIDDAISRFLSARGRTLDGYAELGRYEADRAALPLFNVAIRSVEGVLALARTDLVLFPAAMMAARGAFETSLKAAWLVDCDAHFDRERRWLQLLESEERMEARLAGHLEKAGQDGSDRLKRRDELRAFRLEVERRFPDGYAALKGAPSVEQMMETLHDPQLYVAYIYLSQFLHGERAAASYYAPTDQPRRDAVSANDWSFPLKVVWLAFFRGARKLLVRFGGDPDSFMSEGEEIEVRNALAMIG